MLDKRMDRQHTGGTMRTRLRICKTKMRFVDQAAALVVSARHDQLVRPYRCDRCGAWHLTSRRKGKRIARPAVTAAE